MEEHAYCLSQNDTQSYEKLPVSLSIFHIVDAVCRLILVSDGFCRMFNIDRQELKSYKEIIEKHVYPQDVPKVRLDFETACLNLSGEYKGLYRIAGGKGKFSWFSCNGTVKRMADGSYILYVYFCDVENETERHQEELSEKHRHDVLFSNILSTTNTALFWKDADRRFLGANKAFLDYYGFEDEKAIIGKNDEEMGWHTEPGKYKNDEQRVLEEGISTYRVRGKCIARGENRDIVASKSPMYIDGKIAGLVGSFEDVTTEVRQQAEIIRLNSELERRISDHDQLMNMSDVCIVKIRLSDFSFEEYNDAVCRMIGYSREEYEKLFHHKMTNYFSGEYEAEFENLKRKAIEILKENKRSFTLNMKVPTKNGFTWVGGSASFSENDPVTKKPVSLYAVYRDISDIMQAQQKLAQAEIAARNAAILAEQNVKKQRMIDGVPSGLGSMRIVNGTPEDTIQLNKYFFEHVDIEGEKDGTIDIKNFTSCLHPDDREKCRSDFYKILKDKNLFTSQYRFRRRNSENYYWVRVRCSILPVSEGIEAVYFLYSDIDEIKKAEAELTESRRFYREVVQAAKLVTWEYDIPGKTIVMSDDDFTHYDHLRFGLPKTVHNVPEALVEYICDEDIPKFLELYHTVEEGKNASCDVWYRSVNGHEPRCERITYIVIKDKDKKPVRAIGLGQNITAEKKVEERYQREIGYLKQNDENNLLAKGHYNLTENIVLEYTTLNDSAFKVVPGSTYDKAFCDFKNAAYQEEDRKEIEDKCNRNNLIRRYQLGYLQTSFQYRRSVKNQLPIWMSMNIHTYMMPETGDLECFTYAYDITEKMETDEIMSLISAAEFDYIGIIYGKTAKFEFIKKSPDIFALDIRCKKSYSSCCQYVRKNFVNSDEIEQFDSAVNLENIKKSLQNNTRHVATYHRTEGEKILCKQLDYVWFDKKEEIILVVRTDVTAAFERERQRLEQISAAKLEADRANEAKSVFLSSMSHDLRTPLNGVLGFTGLAIAEKDADKKQDYLKKIDSSGRLLLDLVNDTLELSRIESGKSTLEQEAVMYNNLVPAVVTALRPSAELKSIRFNVDFSGGEKTSLWCDRLKIQKIALNLISNAIKYTPEGGEVKIGFNPIANDDPFIGYCLTVEDTGIGMSDQFMQCMYEPFAQEKRSEAVKVPGTGLGLAIVKRYVDIMGGTISVESHIHKGTLFEVKLPVREVCDIQAHTQERAKMVRSIDGKRVLLCEDNFMNTEIAVMLLKDKGVSTECAANGKEGLEKFSASDVGFYDAVLMDIRMPRMDGYEATKGIRALDRADAKEVPVIAMTADAFEESIRAAQEAGMNDYLTKPIEPDKLYAALSKAISNRKTSEKQ